MIYFDNAATSPISPRVTESFRRVYREFGFNPASPHSLGKRASEALHGVRKTVGDIFGCDQDGVYFTAGATEAANILIQGYSSRLSSSGSVRNEIVISEIEHASVYKTAEFLRHRGWEMRLAQVDRQGRVSPEVLAKLVGPKTAIVCMMTVNNEIGSIQDISALASITKDLSQEILFITDAVQVAGKLPVSYDFSKVDAFFASGHKFGAPKGCGFFYLNPEARIDPILFGGGQEKGYRPGTTDVCSAYLLAEVLVDRTQNMSKNLHHVSTLGRRLKAGLKQRGVQFINTISGDASSPYLLSLSFPGLPSKYAVEEYADRGICVSSGSACSSRSSVRSRVLEALKLPVEQIDTTLRISFSPENLPEEVDIFVEKTAEMMLMQPQEEGAYALL